MLDIEYIRTHPGELTKAHLARGGKMVETQPQPVTGCYTLENGNALTRICKGGQPIMSGVIHRIDALELIDAANAYYQQRDAKTQERRS